MITALKIAPLLAAPFWLRNAIPLALAGSVAETAIRIRHEVNSPEAKPHLESYAKAIRAMKDEESKESPNGTAWRKQATIHQSYCPHGTWNFFPWHREYLFRFEEVIREMSGDPNFTLPYWDWTANPALPEAFKSGELSTNDRSRSSKVHNQIRGYTSVRAVKNVVTSKDFESFMGGASSSGSVEVGPHNGVHTVFGSYGSPMGTFLSPLDPIFWLHHSNIDRLWVLWQEKHPEWANVNQIEKEHPTWLDVQLFGFYTPKGVRFTERRTARDVLNTADMGYVYSGTIAAEAISSIALLPAALKSAPTPFKTNVLASTAGMTPSHIVSGHKYVEATFGEFKQDRPVGVALDEYLGNRSAKENFMFQLHVKKFPKLPPNTSVKMSLILDGSKSKKRVFITDYGFFGGSSNHEAEPSHHDHHMHHGTPRETSTVPEFTLDYTTVLDALQDLAPELQAYPEETIFRIESTSHGLNLSRFPFNKMEISLKVLQRVY